MALLNSYAIWNNKGGVGKSTITFHSASRYAELHPETNVLIIDLCPQANSSMMLLGGGIAGEELVLGYCTLTTPRTVVGYLSTVIAHGAGAALPNPDDYLIRINDLNTAMPDNMFLICGDGNLEPMSPAISGSAAAPSLIPGIQPWVWIHQIFRRLIEHVTELHSDRDWIVFIDTNPSFAIYTELAISAANRLITPVNAMIRLELRPMLCSSFSMDSTHRTQCMGHGLLQAAANITIYQSRLFT